MTGKDLSLPEKLPLELLHYICKLLPLSSAAALALANKFILYRLGWRYFGDLHGDYVDKPEARRFLTLLARDLPHCWACHECLRLHLHHWARPPTSPTAPGELEDRENGEESDGPSSCPVSKIDQDDELDLFGSRTDISWRRLNDIMRASAAGHRVQEQLEELATNPYKPDEGLAKESPKELEELSANLDEPDEGLAGESHEELEELSANSDEDLVAFTDSHVENLFELPYELAFHIDSNGQLLMRGSICFDPRQARTSYLWVCSTYRDYLESTDLGTPNLRPLLECAFDHLSATEQQSCPTCSPLISCHLCATEFVLFRVENDGEDALGRAEPRLVGLRRYQNLGDMSAPFEPFWRSHMNHRSLDWSAGDGEPRSLVQWEPGDIMEMWEQEADEDLDSGDDMEMPDQEVDRG